MTDLTFDGGNNIGGLLLLRFAPVAGIASMTGTAAPVFRTGYRWFNVYGTVGTKGFDEDQDDSDNGPIWTMTIKLFLPGDAADRRATLAGMVRHKFVVEVEDNAGLRRRVGTLTEGLNLTYKFSTGEQMADRRGATLTFRGTLTAPAPAAGAPVL